MFGKIIDIADNYITLENATHEVKTNILNYHIVFPEDSRNVVGEIIGINENEIKVFLVGEIRNNAFIPGVMKKPLFANQPRIVYKNELELLIGSQTLNQNGSIYIGKSSVYEGYSVSTSINDLFSNHFAIIGNTGSGKSCGVSRILQNIFLRNDGYVPKNAHIVLFDVYGEYDSALNGLNNINGMGYQNFTTNSNLNSTNLINIPAYFLEIDDLALLLNVTSASQLPIIEKSLKLVYIFKGQDENMHTYKNDIIAESLLDILSSGKSSTQIRDQIVAILSRYNTKDLNLDTPIYEPGYTRTIKQCLNIDAQGKMNAVQNVVDYLEKFQKLDLSAVKVNKDIVYSLDDLYYAFEFALISEGTLKSDKIYDEYNQLKVRLQQIINSDNKKFFEVGTERIKKSDYIRDLFNSDKHYQIINMNLNYIEDRFAKTLTKIFAKMFFDYCANLDDRASFPIHIILEEAHRYVQNDNDVNVIGYNIFDRITKEGRKYGMLLGLITQRPCELSTTALSQCANFIAFRMFHPDDLNIIKSISSNVSEETVEKIKNLSPGSAMLFGSSFKLPLIAKLELPNPMPKSTSADIGSVWYQ